MEMGTATDNRPRKAVVHYFFSALTDFDSVLLVKLSWEFVKSKAGTAVLWDTS
jgi:hypothetical protein